MGYPLLSLSADPPPGFRFQPSLFKRDVRSGPFALYADSIRTAEEQLREVGGSAAGIILTNSDDFVWEPREFPLFHLGLPPPLHSLLSILLPPLFGLMEAVQSGIDRNRRLALELARTLEDRQRSEKEFERSRESLLEEIPERNGMEEGQQKIFSSLVESSNDLIAIASFDGGLRYMNRSGRKLFGLEEIEEIRTINLREVVFPRHQELLEMLYEELRSSGSWKGRTKFRHHKTGTSVYLETHAFVVRDPETDLGIAFAMIGRDITERRAMEWEMIKIQKLESVGILAGGIAHDFNNLLSAIAGYISLARSMVPHDGEIGEHLSRAEKATFRAKDLTHQLLTFSKGSTPVKKATVVRELVQDSAGWALRGSNVQCDVDITPDLWLVDVDEGQINQVMNNLLINACQAMPEGGTIRISARNIKLKINERPPLAEGNYVRVTVRDHGVGIPGEHLQKIFDPYFTTKPHGSGLGLATSFAIIQKHRGTITVESKLGAGTSFHIFLPVSREAEMGAKPHPVLPSRGEGRILVMDDEEALRDVASSMLRSLGYTTATARDGGEAIAFYKAARERGEPFDAVIMDLTVPGGMGGQEAVAKLRQIEPEAQVIVSSGYSNDDIMANFRAYGFSGAVPKPYSLAQLGEAVARLLNDPQ